jgi:hypothetical protein
VLDRVDTLVGERRLVERRDVPEPEIGRPEEEDCNRSSACPKRSEAPGARSSDEAEGEEQRSQVGDRHVLEHVRREETLVAEAVERRELRCERDPEADAGQGSSGAHRAADA